jgi:hypothetical protein
MREVQQLTRTRADVRGRERTVTRTDGRGWTCCRQMACKRSAVRARLAPLVRSEIRTDRTGSTAAKYSNGGRVGRRTCVRIGHLPPAGLLAGHRSPDAESALVSLSPAQIPASSVPRLLPPGHHPALLEGHSCQRLLPHWQVVRPRWASRSVRFTPRGPRPLARAVRSLTAGAARGDRRVVPTVSVRRWSRWCAAPVKRRGAPWRSPARLSARWCAR